MVDVMPTCERCNGTGVRELTKVERRVLSGVSTNWRTTSEVLAEISSKARPLRTSLCNMLLKLLGLGLVERDDSKRESAWRIKP